VDDINCFSFVEVVAVATKVNIKVTWSRQFQVHFSAHQQIIFSYLQGWVFAMAKSIFARTVEKPVKTGNNWR